ncbi:hypothetical protein ACFU8W_26550 [Streptomyces sp. NPDC057565]|uniref:hypothetical protein n=1 Tax=Streptomyces sp. NPDC057565 TaxID=3346169 RepID=UPI003688F5BC
MKRQPNNSSHTTSVGKTDEAHGTAGDLGRPWAAIHVALGTTLAGSCSGVGSTAVSVITNLFLDHQIRR